MAEQLFPVSADEAEQAVASGRVLPGGNDVKSGFVYECADCGSLFPSPIWECRACSSHWGWEHARCGECGTHRDA